METLGELLRLAARKSVPALHVAYKLKGLSRRVSPRVRELLKPVEALIGLGNTGLMIPILRFYLLKGN